MSIWRVVRLSNCNERNKKFLLKMKIAWEMCASIPHCLSISATIVFLTWSQMFENKRDTISRGMGFIRLLKRPWYRTGHAVFWYSTYYPCLLFVRWIPRRLEDLLHLIKIYYRSYCWNINRNNHSRLQQSKRASIFVAVKRARVSVYVTSEQ